MSLQALAQFGNGGSGLDTVLPKVLKELQGLTISVLTSSASGVKTNEAPIRLEDTIIACIEFVAGVPTDRLGATTIVDVRATGTLTLASAVAGDTCVVGGKTYTFRAAGTADPLKNEVNLGGSDTLSAANLAAKIGLTDPTRFLASNAGAVVTLRAVAEGTGGNALTTVGSARITASGATLTGGTATGGIQVTGVTAANKIILAYFNKK